MENIAGAKFWATLTVLGEGEGTLASSFLVYASLNAGLVVAAVLITMYVGPAAAGSGIADVKVRAVGWAARRPRPVTWPGLAWPWGRPRKGGGRRGLAGYGGEGGGPRPA